MAALNPLTPETCRTCGNWFYAPNLVRGICHQCRLRDEMRQLAEDDADALNQGRVLG